MALVGILGDRKDVNRWLLYRALAHPPTLVLDCDNCANPHVFNVPAEAFTNIFVMQVDLIYTFRDTMLRLATVARTLGVRRIVITTHSHLFNYGNAEENENVLRHAWEEMRTLGTDHDVMVGMTHEGLREYCDVVRTWDIQSGVNA